MLTTLQQDRMFTLFSDHYDGVSRNNFNADLDAKTSVILLEDENAIIRGFSTQEIYDTIHDGESVRILFSGDTIIEPQYWGSQELVRGWCALVARMLKNAGQIKCYWFLISKGYRTYLYLPVFFKHYYPQHDGHNNELAPLLDQLASAKFSSAYDKNLGVIRFNMSHGHLRKHLHEVPPRRSENQAVIFFLERNPHFTEGVELACLAEISIKNTHGVGKRMLRQAIAEIS